MSIEMEDPNAVAVHAMPAVPTSHQSDRSLARFAPESMSVRWIWLGIAAVVISIYGWRTLHYWAPADGGVDQNAYLLGGRMMAEHFSTRYTLPNPYAYVGGMMMRSSPYDVPGGDYYPKYPLGLPLLYAMFFWIFGATHGATLAFLVSPISSILAVTGMFFLARLLAGSFAALMAAILLGCSQLMIELSNNPNSHASCVAFIVWGMYVLLRWWQSGGIWRGVLAGFLIGYACLIRYSEGLLVLPIAVVCLSRLRWNDLKTYRALTVAVALAGAIFLIGWQASAAAGVKDGTSADWTGMHKVLNGMGSGALICVVIGLLILRAIKNDWDEILTLLRNMVPGLAWSVPVVLLLIYNKHSMGHWTGYDSTNESEGFSWVKFKETWEQMLRTYYDTGAFFVLPFGLAGLLMVFGRSWQLGVMLLAWLLPGSALYTAYYWSPDSGISYARFFLTFLPAIMVGAAICFSDAILLPARNARWPYKIPRIVAVVLITGIAASLGVYRSVHGLQEGHGGARGGGGMTTLAEQSRVRQNLAAIGKVLLDHVPVNSVLVADSSGGVGPNERPLNYIQFLRHWDTYSSDAFSSSGPRGIGGQLNNIINNLGLANADPNQVPTTRQKLQEDYLAWLYHENKAKDPQKEKAKLINSALNDGRHVFALATVDRDRDIRIFFNIAGRYSISTVQTWSDLPPLPVDPVSENSGNTNGRRPGGFGGFGAGGGGGGGGIAARRGGGGRRANFAGGPPGAGLTTTEPATRWELLEIKPAS
jgi:4-amino-4-deoxy-L-arabinose transferase-like glycosyltransferase